MITTILTFLKAHKLAAILGAVILVAALLAGTYFKGRGDGVEATEARYAAMALETAKKAREASETATAGKDQRDDDFALEQKEIENAVQNAIANGDDSIIAYFDELRKVQSGSDKTAR